jgi:hypothetical protein
MSATKDISREAGEQFRFAAQFSFEDAGQQRLRYHLLRLTSVGLTKEDVEELGELGRLAFQESDVTEQATKIKQRADASSLAFAIADILDGAGSGVGGPVSLRAVMLGAVLGAYTSVSRVPEVDQSAVAILGAIGGAVAASTSTFIRDNVDRRAWAEYLRMQD